MGGQSAIKPDEMQDLNVAHSTANVACGFLGFSPGSNRFAIPPTHGWDGTGPADNSNGRKSPTSRGRGDRTPSPMFRLRFPSPGPTPRSPSPFKERLRGFFTPKSMRATPEHSPRRYAATPTDVRSVRDSSESTASSTLAGVARKLRDRIKELRSPSMTPSTRSPVRSPRGSELGDAPDFGVDGSGRSGATTPNKRTRSPSPFARFRKDPSEPPKYATADQILSALHEKLRVRSGNIYFPRVEKTHQPSSGRQTLHDMFGSTTPTSLPSMPHDFVSVPGDKPVSRKPLLYAVVACLSSSFLKWPAFSATDISASSLTEACKPIYTGKHEAGIQAERNPAR